MIVVKSKISGLLLIKPEIFEDNRGYFFESFHKQKFHHIGINHEFVQDNESWSAKGVLRGLHFQKPPFAQGKLVRVIKGAVLDVAVDLRKDSPTYGKWESVELNGENKLMYWIPPGFAHGFVALRDDTIFSYKCTHLYHRESECSIIWNDPILNIDWKIDKPILAPKDLKAGLFKDLVSPF